MPSQPLIVSRTSIRRFAGLLLLIAVLAPARVLPAQPFRWGVGAGASYQQLVLDAPLPQWSDEGLVFPTLLVFGEAPLSRIEGPLGRRLHLGGGLRYNRQAGRIAWTFEVSESMQTFSGTFTIKQHYVSIPLWLRLDLGDSPLFLTAGPEASLLVAARKESRTDTPASARSRRDDAVAEQLNRLGVALRAGAGVRLGGRARAVLTYCGGLTSAKKNADQPVLVSDWQNREWAFELLYSLRE
ncbi:MAG: porin family protein [Rhodothermales bacterium]